MINKKKIIEIRGINFQNKGSELMLYAIIEKIKSQFKDVEFAMSPTIATASMPYLKRVNFLMYQKTQLWFEDTILFIFDRIIPSILSKKFYNFFDKYGIIFNRDIDIVLDAAGFAYSDQWGKEACKEIAFSSKMWKKRKIKSILLPQALGPFESLQNQKYMKETLNNVDLVFAREKKSYDFVFNILKKNKRLKLAPDFTNLVEGILPEKFDKQKNCFCIIPNYRMVDKTIKFESEAYLPLMIEITKYAHEKKQKPFILLHEGKDDLLIAKKIRDTLKINIEIIREQNPLKIKGILGTCKCVVSSRYHGLISALSQGVPALATGWSHKYEMLLKDYEFDEGLLNLNIDKKEMHKKLDFIINEESNKNLVKKILFNAERLKKETNNMWDEVFNLL